MTLVFEQKFTSFESAIDCLIDIGKAIDTPFFPSSKNVKDFVSEFAQIQVGRRFTNSGFGRADLALWFDEEELRFTYCSTSGTEVDMLSKFNDEMEVYSVFLKVGIPEDRCHPGGGHYEAITSAVQQYNWHRLIGNYRAVMRGKDRPVEYLQTPIWVLDYVSNTEAYQNKHQVDHVFSRYGFSPCHATGYKFAWKHEDGRIILQKRGNVEDTFYLTREESDRLPAFWWSFRRICEELRHKTWQKAVGIDLSKPRKSLRDSSESEEEVYDIEDYDLSATDLDEEPEEVTN